MWNDTDIPLAYLITFRTYASWLHGDKRGSTNRFRNLYGSRHLPPNKNWLETNKERLNLEKIALNAKQRSCVEKAIKETCCYREWQLYATNVRTNHIHVVVSAGLNKPEKILGALKANATGTMKENGCWHFKQSPWSDKGSSRYLWNEKSVDMAIEYVLDGQGDELPRFE